MKPTEFVKVNGQFWGEHLKGVAGHLPVSHRSELPGPMLFPRMMVLTETPDWNILELVGLSREYRSLEVRRQKVGSIEEYFGLGDGRTVVANLQGQNWFKDATIATEAGRKTLVEQFPKAGNMLGEELVGPADELLRFAPGNYSTFDRALLVQTSGDSLRAHWVFFALAIHRSEPADKYLDFLRNYINSRPHLDPVGTISLPIDPAALSCTGVRKTRRRFFPFTESTTGSSSRPTMWLPLARSRMKSGCRSPSAGRRTSFVASNADSRMPSCLSRKSSTPLSCRPCAR